MCQHVRDLPPSLPPSLSACVCARVRVCVRAGVCACVFVVSFRHARSGPPPANSQARPRRPGAKHSRHRTSVHTSGVSAPLPIHLMKNKAKHIYLENTSSVTDTQKKLYWSKFRLDWQSRFSVAKKSKNRPKTALLIGKPYIENPWFFPQSENGLENALILPKNRKILFEQKLKRSIQTESAQYIRS